MPPFSIRNDEYLFGDDLLVAPVTKDDGTSRQVYLPRGVWYDFWTDHRSIGSAKIDAAAPMVRIPLFVRGDAIIPSQQDMLYTDQAAINPLTLDVYPDGASSCDYYEDDGISCAVRLDISAREGSFSPPKRSLVIKIHGHQVEPQQVTVAGAALAGQASVKALQDVAQGWAYDESAGVVWIRVPDSGTAVNVRALQ